MALSSMTGFGRADGSRGAQSWHWEVRSVNGRGLDLRLRLPPGTDTLEARVRDAAQKRLARGSVTVNLTHRREGDAFEIRLNERALADVLKAADRVRQATGSGPVAAEALLGVRGVLEVVEAVESEAEASARGSQMLASLELALDGLVAARRSEGKRLADILSRQIDEVERLVAAIERAPGRKPEAVAERLREQIARILEAGTGLDPQRVHQEAVMLATRADVEEELKRLASHVAAVRQLLAAEEPVGRKLDFLAQEFFREASTLCAKSNDAETTRLGLELKSVIDQMREQVQNIE